MTMIARLFIPAIAMAISISGCTDAGDSSPYEELLSRQPYASLTDSIHKTPSDPGLYYRRGLLLLTNNNQPPALDDFRKAWSMDKKEAYAIGISTILVSKKPDSAIVFLQDALKFIPNSIPLQLNLAQSYASQQKTDEALNVCNHIIQQQPNQLDALEMKANLLEAKNDTTGSIKTLEQAYRFAFFDEEFCYNLAFKYAQSKNPKALTLCDSLLHAGTINNKAEPFYFKGVYYANINDLTRAIDFFNKAIQHDYTFLDAYMDKGKILYEQKKYNEALKVYQLVLSVSSTYADGYYWLGKCQEALGQKEEARLNYQRAYGLDKSLVEAKEAADRLK